MKNYNIYFGTIGKKLGVKYQFTTKCKDDESAKQLAKESAASLFFKNEGRYGIPNFSQISKESDITGISIDDLYQEHIEDMMRYYAIPTELDTISRNKLK